MFSFRYGLNVKYFLDELRLQMVNGADLAANLGTEKELILCDG